MARYGAEGVRTVLVTCTGGEAGDILNPEADTEEVRADLAAVRRRELDDAVRIIGYDAAVPARLPRLGHARHRAERAPRQLRQRRPRRGRRAPGGDHPLRAAAGVGRLRGATACTRTPITYACTRSPCSPSSGPATPTGTPSSARPWQPLKLYYTSGFTRERIQSMHDWFVEQGEESPFTKWIERIESEAASDAPDDRPHHHAIDVRELPRRRRATRCSRTTPRCRPTASSSGCRSR